MLGRKTEEGLELVGVSIPWGWTLIESGCIHALVKSYILFENKNQQSHHLTG